MADSAALLVDDILPHQPMRQWVLSLPFPLNLNNHFHMLLLDGVYLDSPDGSRPRFRWVKAPTSEELTQLTHTIAHRVDRYLQRQGWLVSDTGNCFLTAEGLDVDNEVPMHHLLGRVPLPTALPSDKTRCYESSGSSTASTVVVPTLSEQHTQYSLPQSLCHM